LKKKLVPILLMSLTSFFAQALGLGEMRVRSFLNQPFDAEIELTDLGNTSLLGIKADIASLEDFERMGMDRANVLNFLNLNVEKNEAGKPVIKVRSIERITDPYLQILVDVVWATGQVYRSYTILLDPPSYKLTTIKKQHTPGRANEVLKEQPGVIDQAVQTEVNHNPQSVDTVGEELNYGPTRANETIWQIAQRYRNNDVLLQQMILAIVGANPDAFAESNLNGLKENSTLTIPSTSVAKTIPAEQAKLEVFAHDSAWQSKQPIEHVLFPPYTDSDEETPHEEKQLPLLSQIPSAPVFKTAQTSTATDFSTYMPKALPTLPTGTESNTAMDLQTMQQAKLKVEMDLAIAAIGSVREANNILKEQLALAQTENKRLLAELTKRDRQLKQLQKEISVIKTRQGLAGQAIQDTYESDTSIWPWLLLLLILIAAGGVGYWWLWLRPRDEENKIEPKKSPPTPAGSPNLTSLENPAMSPQMVFAPPDVEEVTMKQEESFAPDVNPVEPMKKAKAKKESKVNVKEKGKEEDEISIESNVIEFIDEPNLQKDEINDIDLEKNAEPQSKQESSISKLILEEIDEKKGLELEEKKDEPSLEFKPELVDTDISPPKPAPVKSQKALDTLLDLAKTYISMGDKEAAHQSLEEVLKHGSKEQKIEAQNLIKNLEMD
jgi:pilus assembly protein FimV